MIILAGCLENQVSKTQRENKFGCTRFFTSSFLIVTDHSSKSLFVKAQKQ